MKKLTSAMICIILIITCFTGCSAEINKNGERSKISVVATIFPEYDWVKAVTGEDNADVSVKLLLDKGVDMHSYQPTVKDMADLISCDVLVYVGGESDRWIDDALAEAEKEIKTVKLLDVLGEYVMEEEASEGMQSDEDEEEEEAESDEHVWLSLRNAEIAVNEISRVLSECDPDNSVVYSQNAMQYTEKLRSLDSKYSEMVTDSELDTMIFADRFPFRYLTEDYDLKYYAAFPGCSSETDASFRTIKFLADKIDEYEVPAVLTVEGSGSRIADSIISCSSHKKTRTAVLDSMQSVSFLDVKKGLTYLSVMEKNYEVLKSVLNRE